MTPGEASRFLMQASFGPTVEEIARLQRIGYSAWIDEQLAKPVQRHLPVLLAQPSDAPDGRYWNHRRKFVWWQQSVTAEDQLRQRIAYAWSQHFVVSDKSTDAFVNDTPALCDYYDTLLTNGTENFRDLLKAVTYHPCMGVYLDYVGNEKSESMRKDDRGARRPDENYAREVMQLFTIGLHLLNRDGTPQLQDGRLIPTYDNEDVREMARVFTGMHFAGRENNWQWGPVQMLRPLKIYREHHDPFRKVLLAGRKELPAHQYPEKDIDDALDCLFEHENTPPFVCRFLIQRLVTSNPSPAYLDRVAQVFIDNGNGVRGDLNAVTHAILLDPEARQTAEGGAKEREPYLRLVALVRAFKGRASSKDGIFAVAYLDDLLGQEPGSAPSVFNFYSPDYAPPGPIANAGLVAPEFQITDAVTSISLPNFLRDCVYRSSIGRWGNNILLDFTYEKQIAATPPLLIDHLSLILAGDRMNTKTRSIVLGAVDQIPQTQLEDRVKLAVYLTSICAESVVQS